VGEATSGRNRVTQAQESRAEGAMATESRGLQATISGRPPAIRVAPVPCGVRQPAPTAGWPRSRRPAAAPSIPMVPGGAGSDSRTCRDRHFFRNALIHGVASTTDSRSQRGVRATRTPGPRPAGPPQARLLGKPGPHPPFPPIPTNVPPAAAPSRPPRQGSHRSPYARRFPAFAG